MFSLRNFIKAGLLDAVGKLADYQVMLNAAGWFEKGVLVEEDLAEIQSRIDEKNVPQAAAESGSEDAAEAAAQAEEEVQDDDGE